jgi:RimJ/RimL family protein N-acetyltransferase
MTELEKQTTDLWTAPITLTGRKLRVEPLGLHHLDDLEKNVLRPHSWHGLHWGIQRRQDLENIIRKVLQGREERAMNGFAMVLQDSNEAVGMSRLMAFNRPHKYLEIGATWVGQDWQKTFVNTEAKLLMLGYAFEAIGCQRVEFRVDALNFNSQRAVMRLGAKFEGELRNTAILPDGRKRDYRMYSILDSEWPSVKLNLKFYLEMYV